MLFITKSASYKSSSIESLQKKNFTYQNWKILKHVTDEQDTIGRWSPAGLVDLHPLLPQTGPAVCRAAGARAARRIPVLGMAFERARRVLRAGLGEIGHRLEQLGFWGATETPDQSHEQAYRCCGDQQASKRVDEYPVFGRDLLGQEHAELRLEVEDTRDPDACADHAQADQMILEVVLGEVSAFLACVDRGENRDRGQGQLLQDAGRVQRPDKGRAKFCRIAHDYVNITR